MRFARSVQILLIVDHQCVYIPKRGENEPHHAYSGGCPDEAHSQADKQRSQKRFLNAYADFAGSVTPALVSAQISRADHTRWLECDPHYARLFRDEEKRQDERKFRFALFKAYEGARRGNARFTKFIREEYGEAVLSVVLQGKNPIPA